jgi:prolipoprotein diacylglyceryltransferase
MFPRLIQIGSFYLPTYGVILAIAYLVGIWMLRRKARAEGLPEQ